MNYASIVPLIGGETIAMENVFGKRPEYILSYSDFTANDSQLLNYYNHTIPYLLLDQGGLAPSGVDVVNTVCPCAGLSSLSPTSSGDSTTNDWMVKSAEYVLESIQPTVFWGENAPRLASKMGEPVVRQLREIGKRNGYVFSIYKTKSILHGLSQVRDRTFYFFWKGNHVPVFDYYKRDYVRIEDQIRSSATNEPDPMFEQVNNKQKPSDNPYYQYVLEEMHGGITHPEFFKQIDKTTNPLHYIEDKGVSYKDVGVWMAERGHQKLAEKCNYMFDKLSAGGNIMRKMTEIGKDHIGAFVGHFPHSLCHPDEDRYINTREALDIMKMPKDFILQGGVRNLNMICQNVPVTTAMDMAENVKGFLGGDLETIEAEFMLQDNKTQSYKVEKAPNTLEAFIS
jgi:site-specific DNA-cytosine methylase